VDLKFYRGVEVVEEEEDTSWNRVCEALRKLGAGRGERCLWGEDTTYVVSVRDSSSELVRKYHPPLQDGKMRCLEQWRSEIDGGRVDGRGNEEDTISAHEVQEARQRGHPKRVANGGAARIGRTASRPAQRLFVVWGYISDCWKIAQVVWLPKPKGGYRPTSLTH